MADGKWVRRCEYDGEEVEGDTEREVNALWRKDHMLCRLKPSSIE